MYEMDDAQAGGERMGGARGGFPEAGMDGLGAVEGVQLG
jgi:hypothetical protein